MKFIIVILIAWLSVATQAQQGFYTRFDSVVSSGPVSIDDMVNGWDGDYQRAETAFADISWAFGFDADVMIADQYWGAVTIQREYRHYYYLSFDPETADYYRALETGEQLSSDKKLDLEFKQFDAPGIALGYDSQRFQYETLAWQVGFDIAIYQPGNFQFGSVKGIAEAGSTDAASGIIDYRYDNDNLLDHQAQVDRGLGFSISTEFLLELEQWQAEVQLKDMFNQFQWDNGAFTQGCINIGGGSKAQCESEGSASGISSQKRVTETIPLTLNTRLTHTQADISLHGLMHDRYYRLGLEKGVQTSLGRLGFFLYYPRLVGLSWQTSLFNIELGADTLKFSQARNIQLNMGINWRW